MISHYLGFSKKGKFMSSLVWISFNHNTFLTSDLEACFLVFSCVE